MYFSLLISRQEFISNSSNNDNTNYFYNIIDFGNDVVNNDGTIIFLQYGFRDNEIINMVHINRNNYKGTSTNGCMRN